MANEIIQNKKLPNVLEEAIEISDFITMDVPSRPIILDPWLRESSLVMIYAERGIGKTWLGLSIAFSIVTGQPIGNWEIINPVGVLYIDGEVSADEMQDRMKKLSAGLSPRSAPLRILSSDLLHQNDFASVNLCDLSWRKNFYDALKKQQEIKVLILDNLSCLTPGIEENDKVAWDDINQWLISLRFLGIAVIFLHHAGKGGKQRGTSGREDALNVVINLSKPPGHKQSDGAKFIVSFEKSRGVCGNSLSPFTFSIGKDEKGNTVWLTDRVNSSNNKGLIIALLGEGKSPNEIISEVECTKQNISKHKQWAIEKGFLSEDGKSGVCRFTEKGREKYGAYLDDI